jgi:5-methylcytosine-specific restriction endonuclease McrA
MGSRAGILKVAAARIGVSEADYDAKINAGEKWCWSCKQWLLKPNFANDNSRTDGHTASCRECRNAHNRSKHIPVPEDKRKVPGPLRIKQRDGDKEQARSRINHDVRMGQRPNSNDLYCAYCGHKGSDRRHEYHHVTGYDEGQHNDVLPVCSKCHRNIHGESYG